MPRREPQVLQTAAGKTVLLDRSSKCTNQKFKRRLSTAADRIANAPPKLFLVGESKREWSGRLALTVTTRRSLIERLAFFSDDLAYNNEQVNWTSSEYTELYEGSMSVDAPSRDFFRDVVNARHDVKIQFPMPLQRICQIDAASTAAATGTTANASEPTSPAPPVSPSASPAPTTTSASASEPSGVSRLGVATTSTAVLALLLEDKLAVEFPSPPRCSRAQWRKVRRDAKSAIR